MKAKRARAAALATAFAIVSAAMPGNAAERDQPTTTNARAAAETIALATAGRTIPTFHPGWLMRQWLDEISYSDALGLANARQITDILVNETSPPEIFIRTPSGSAYRFTLPSITDLGAFARDGVRVSVMAGATTMSLLADTTRTLLEISFAVGILAIAAAQAKGRIRMPARRIRPEATTSSFADIAGQDQAVAELREITALLRNPEALRAIGARVPRGVVLLGPPGNGKTMMARAVANEAGVPFLNIHCGEIFDKFIGEGSKRVRAIMRQARRLAPCVLFLDEIDVLTPMRNGAGGTDAAEDRAQILATMLVEIDGMEQLGDVVIIGATNRFGAMDPAILRQGRLERHIQVPAPTRAGRRAILELEARRIRLDESVRMDRVERITIGFSGADLSGMMNEAALAAVRDGRTAASMADIVGARDRLLLGAPTPGVPLSDAERLLTARHEAGHVVAALHAVESDRIDRATILPRAQWLGQVQRLPDPDRQTTSRSRLLSDLAVAMGGRASEMLHYPPGEVTTGARGDLHIATAIARGYVMVDGLDDQVGAVSLAAAADLAAWPPPALADLAGERIKALLDEALSRALADIEAHRDELGCVVAALLEAETLSGDDIERLAEAVRQGRAKPPGPAALEALLAATSTQAPGLTAPARKMVSEAA